jgi:Rrf2 family protein
LLISIRTSSVPRTKYPFRFKRKNRSDKKLSWYLLESYALNENSIPLFSACLWAVTQRQHLIRNQPSHFKRWHNSNRGTELCSVLWFLVSLDKSNKIYYIIHIKIVRMVNVMKISSKGRYALVSMIFLAQNYESGKLYTVISISERFNISKIYLEQVFSLLKKNQIVSSVKGSQGGYQLTRSPSEITVLDILSGIEGAMFEPSDETVPTSAPEIEKALKETIYTPLDNAMHAALEKLTLADLVTETNKNIGENSMMYYI